MTNALAIYKDFDGLQRAATALQKSGFFKDVQTEAQAIVKVMAGSELGLPPFASMSGIHIIQGKPVLGSNVIATLVKNDPRYDYRIKQADDQACILTWYEDGKHAGESSFTLAEAQKITTKENNQVIKLSEKATWRFYPSDMLFARAISRGARRFAPGIFGGSPVYTPDEMGADTDEDGYIDGTSVTISTPDLVTYEDPIDKAIEDAGPVLPTNGYDFSKRPYDTSTLKAALYRKAKDIGGYGASEKQRNLLGALLSEFYQGDDTARYTASTYLFGASSTKDIGGAMIKAALDWLKPEKDDGGAYVIDVTARKELSSVLAAAQTADGQDALL